MSFAGLAGHLQGVARGMEAHIAQGLEQAALLVENAAKAELGAAGEEALAASIGHEGEGLRAVVGARDAGMAAVELGSREAPPRAVLSGALLGQAEAVKAALGDAVRGGFGGG